jgi:hypothetical protein
MQIGLMSVADIDNYGDKFFSFITRQALQQRLPEAGFEFITPTGATVEGQGYRAFEPAAMQGIFSALLLIGGEVIHAEDALLNQLYERIQLKPGTANPTDMVYGLTKLKVNYRAWVSVGITSGLASPESERRIRRTVPGLNHISLRGLLAKDNLEALLGNSISSQVVPDVCWNIPIYQADYNLIWTQVAERCQLKLAGQPYMIFHTFSMAIKDDKTVQMIAASLNRIQESTGLRVLLLPITRYSGDAAVLTNIQSISGNRFILLPTNLTMLETASALLHARLQVGSSLHGALTCLAAGIPAGVIHPGEAKFSDLFGHQMRLNFLQRDWAKLEELVTHLLLEPVAPLKAYAELMRLRLAQLFDQLSAEIKVAINAPDQVRRPYQSQLNGNDSTYRRREWLITSDLNRHLQEALTYHEGRVKELEAYSGHLQQSISDKAAYIAQLEQKLVEIQLGVGDLAQEQTLMRQYMNQLEQGRVEVDGYVKELEQVRFDLESRIHELEQQLKVTEQSKGELEQTLQLLQNTLAVKLSRQMSHIGKQFTK